jgi:hypothetical protein
MAARLREALLSPALTITIGDFEEVDVEEHGFDAVFSATAYHWISPQAQVDRSTGRQVDRSTGRQVGECPEARRCDCDRRPEPGSPDDKGFFAAAQPIYERYGAGHAGPPTPERNALEGVDCRPCRTCGARWLCEMSLSCRRGAGGLERLTM